MNKLFLFLCALLAVLHAGATTFGPLKVVRCPYCNETTMKYYPATSGSYESSASRSDGYVDTPWLPQAPVVVKCPRCDSYVILKEHIHDGPGYDEPDREKAETLPYAHNCEPDFIGYMEAFALIEDERLACLSAIHSYNHQFAADDYLSNRAAKPGMWAWKERLFRKAVTKFLPMLDERVQGECLLKAELLREIGEFDSCIELLDTRKRSFDKAQRKIADRIIAEAKRKNRIVFLL